MYNDREKTNINVGIIKYSTILSAPPELTNHMCPFISVFRRSRSGYTSKQRQTSRKFLLILC